MIVIVAAAAVVVVVSRIIHSQSADGWRMNTLLCSTALTMIPNSDNSKPKDRLIHTYIHTFIIN